MIRTLRITSIIAAILAAVLLVLLAVYGVRRDPQIEELLNAPNALDKFATSKGQRPAGDEGQVSPLVKQAADFANYLNPPPPPTPPPSSAEAAAPEPAPLAPVSAKFDLVGTSYYASHPELSLALIDEPGKGLHWVRQGESIAHLTIEKVSGGSVTIRDGQRTSEMAVKVDEQWRNLVKGAAPETRPSSPASPAPVSRPAMGGMPPGGSATSSPPKGRGPDTAALRRGPRGPRPATGGANVSSTPPAAKSGEVPVTQAKPTPEPPGKIGSPAVAPVSAEMSTQREENAAADTSPPPPPPTEKDMIHQRLIDEVKASKITADEAAKMEQLAETLEQLEELQRQKSAQTSSPEPNTPPDANQ